MLVPRVVFMGDGKWATCDCHIVVMVPHLKGLMQKLPDCYPCGIYTYIYICGWSVDNCEQSCMILFSFAHPAAHCSRAHTGSRSS